MYGGVRKYKILILGFDGAGYCQVTLCKNKTHKSFRIHRLVCMAFHENPENKQTINHIDGVKSNNKLENLEWATQSENLKEAYRIGLRDFKGETAPFVKLTEKQVLEIRAKKAINPKENIAIEYGVSVSAIYNILNRKTWKHI